MKHFFYRITPILIGLFCLILTPALAQNNTIDSLSSRLHTAKQDSNKVNILIQLGTENYPSDLKNAKVYAEEGLRLAKSLNFQFGIASGNFILAKIQNKMNFPGEALLLYEKSLAIYGQKRNRAKMADILNNMGIIYKNQGKYLNALDAYEEAFNYYTSLNDQSGASKTLVNMGNLSKKLGNHKKAAEHYFTALQVFDSLGN
ncbi:MAG: tetratricopeptide repeat protein, partial [Cyclobacteriaceae bacterium]